MSAELRVEADAGKAVDRRATPSASGTRLPIGAPIRPTRVQAGKLAARIDACGRARIGGHRARFVDQPATPGALPARNDAHRLSVVASASPGRQLRRGRDQRLPVIWRQVEAIIAGAADIRHDRARPRRIDGRHLLVEQGAGLRRRDPDAEAGWSSARPADCCRGRRSATESRRASSRRGGWSTTGTPCWSTKLLNAASTLGSCAASAIDWKNCSDVALP